MATVASRACASSLYSPHAVYQPVQLNSSPTPATRLATGTTDSCITEAKSGGDVTKFLSYCASDFIEGPGKQLQWMYDGQFRLTWHEYVGSQAIPWLSPELARIYAIGGPKTLTRDLNELVSIALLRAATGRYQAERGALMSLLPLTCAS